jgi:hypothetical protein
MSLLEFLYVPTGISLCPITLESLENTGFLTLRNQESNQENNQESNQAINQGQTDGQTIHTGISL